MRAFFAPQRLSVPSVGHAAFRTSLFLLALTLMACGGGSGAGAPGASGPPGGQMPPMPVQAVTLSAKPVDQVGEFIGTVKSRRSTTIQPQVEGFITRIPVKSGDRVRAGAVLVEIDPRQQQAAVVSLQSQKAALLADVQYARQQAQRAKTLYDAGATSQQELEQAQTAAQTGEAQMAAVDSQIQQQNVTLAYYRVTAPVAGIVGDIPSRVGDRVTSSTVITTVDQNEGLELYINVPVQQGTLLAMKLPIRLLSDTNEVLATTEVNFISTVVSDGTQSILVKAPLAANTGFRTDQFVRSQLVWSTKPGLTVPLTAVTRVNGQYFAFIAEKSDQGTVARQRPLNLGPMVGNDYTVIDGLKPGEELIVSGIQKIGDGAPVQIVPASAAAPGGAAPAAGGEGK